MGKVGKQTKKFQTKHLKRTLDHRNEGKKHKQLMAKHNGTKPKAKIAVEEVVEENPFDVESEGEPEDFGVIDKKGKSSIDEESEDDDIFDELDQMADSKLEEEEEEEEVEDEVEEDEAEEELEVVKKSLRIEVTAKLLKQWEENLLNKPSLKLIKNVIQAFKSAINLNNEELSVNQELEYKYYITSDKVFTKLLTITLKKLPLAINKMYPLKSKFNKDKNIEVRSIKDSDRLKQLSSVLKQHGFSLIHLLNDIQKNNYNLKFILLILSSIYDIFPYILSFRPLLKKLLGSVINLWGTLINGSENKDNIDSFLDINVITFSMILNLAKEFPAILELIINTSYEVFLKRALNLSSSISLDSSNIDLVSYKKYRLIEFLKIGLIDLFKLDLNLSYQIGFKYIRKLSIHLRNYLKNNSNIKNENEKLKNLRLIYNWQYVQSLDFWSQLLSENLPNLAELQYPVIQIILGTIKLNNNVVYFPLKFYLINSLINLSAKTGLYIPLFNFFIELLNSNIFNKNIKAKSLLQTHYYMNTFGIKVSKNSVQTTEYQVYIINNYLNSLQNYLYIYINNLSFPEFNFVMLKNLKKFIKTHGKKNKSVVYFIKELNSLIDKIIENNKFVVSHRDKLTRFDPVKTSVLDIELQSFPLYKFLTAKKQVLQEGKKLYDELLVSEQKNDGNERKSVQDKIGEEYFANVKGKKNHKDAELSDAST